MNLPRYMTEVSTHLRYFPSILLRQNHSLPSSRKQKSEEKNRACVTCKSLKPPRLYILAKYVEPFILSPVMLYNHSKPHHHFTVREEQ